MDKEKQREFDPQLKKVFDSIKNCSPGSLSGFASANEEMISNLVTKISSCVDSLANYAWTDQITSTITTSVDKINELLTACTKPAHQILGQVASFTGSLMAALTSYDSTLKSTNELVDSHNKEVDVLATIQQYKTTTTENKETGEVTKKTEVTDEYANQVNKILGIKGQIKTKDEELEMWKKQCDEYIEILKGLLSDIGSEKSQAALSAVAGTTRAWENIDPSEIDSKFKDGYTVTGIETLDASGKVISRTYTVYNDKGEVVRTGSIYYDKDGKPIISNYIEHYDKPTPAEEISKHAVPGDDTGLTAYFDDDVEAVKTEREEKTAYAPDDDGDGVTTYEELAHEKKEFADGAETDMNYDTVGVATETDLGVEKDPRISDGEGTLETPDGEVYDVTTHEEWGLYGRDEKEVSITDQDTQEKVVDATDTVVERIEDEHGMNMITEQTATVVNEDKEEYVTVTSFRTQSDYDDGDPLYTEGYTAQVNKNDPNLVTMEVVDGDRKRQIRTYYENGVLYEEEVEDGEVQYVNEVSPYHNVTVTFEYTARGTGEHKTKTVTYNSSTNYGCAQLSTEMRKALTDAGYWNSTAHDQFYQEGNGTYTYGDESGTVTVTLQYESKEQQTLPEAAQTINSRQ